VKAGQAGQAELAGQTGQAGQTGMVELAVLAGLVEDAAQSVPLVESWLMAEPRSWPGRGAHLPTFRAVAVFSE